MHIFLHLGITHTITPNIHQCPLLDTSFSPRCVYVCLWHLLGVNNRLLRHSDHKLSWHYIKITARFREIFQSNLSALQLHSSDSCSDV